MVPPRYREAPVSRTAIREIGINFAAHPDTIVQTYDFHSQPTPKYDKICHHLIFFGSHAEKSFLNLIKSNRNHIVFTILRSIWNQTDVRLIPNQLEDSKYNLISVWLNKIWKIFVSVHIHPRRARKSLSLGLRSSPSRLQKWIYIPIILGFRVKLCELNKFISIFYIFNVFI